MARTPSTIGGKHPLIDCPACHELIVANIIVELDIGEAALGNDGPVARAVGAPASAPTDVRLEIGTKLTRYNVRHDCRGPVEQADARELGEGVEDHVDEQTGQLR